MQNLYGAQTILHSKSLCYSTPPERGHLSRTGHIGGYYMLVYTVLNSNRRLAYAANPRLSLRVGGSKVVAIL